MPIDVAKTATMGTNNKIQNQQQDQYVHISKHKVPTDGNNQIPRRKTRSKTARANETTAEENDQYWSRNQLHKHSI